MVMRVNKKLVVTLLLAVVMMVVQAFFVSAVEISNNETLINFTRAPNAVVTGNAFNLTSSFVNGTYNLTINTNASLVLNIINVTIYVTNRSGGRTNIGFLNQTNITRTACEPNCNVTFNLTFTSTLIGDNIYNFTANITNSTGDNFIAIAQNVTVDNTATVVGLNVSNGTFQNNTISLNWTTADVGNASQHLNCSVEVDGVQNVSSTTAFTSNLVVNSLAIYTGTGLHSYNVTCKDRTNNNGTSSLTYWLVANSPPNRVEVFSPINLSTENYINQSFNYSFRVTDNVDTTPFCSVVINETFRQVNVTVNNYTNVSLRLNLDDNFTAFNVSLNCSNSGYANFTSLTNSTNTEAVNISNKYNFTTNGALPVVYLNSPANGGSTELTSFGFVCNASDQRLTNLTFYRGTRSGTETGDASNFAANTSNSSGGAGRTNWTVNFSETNVGSGTITWNCNANDSGGNSAFAAANFTFTRSVVVENLAGGGSAGGGGGGRGSTLAKISSFSLSSDGTSQALVAYSRMVKSVNLPDGSATTVTVTRVYNNERAFVMVGDQEYELFEGQSALSDVNGDGLADVEVTLQDAFLTKAHLTLRAVSQPVASGVTGKVRDDEKTGQLGGKEAFVEAVENTLGGEAPAEAASEDGAGNEVTGASVVEASTSGVWSMLGVLALVLAGVAGYYWYYRPNNKRK
ncbi:hypothetical protein HYS47_03050 [Candidatus Woesearchaeota archaeon]|nr:hypothetical protein [Candidatus Woesearchaeota archaeon]